MEAFAQPGIRAAWDWLGREDVLEPFVEAASPSVHQAVPLEADFAVAA